MTRIIYQIQDKIYLDPKALFEMVSTNHSLKNELECITEVLGRTPEMDLIEI